MLLVIIGITSDASFANREWGWGWVAEKTVTYAFAACIFQGFLGKALNYTRKDEEESRRQLLLTASLIPL